MVAVELVVERARQLHVEVVLPLVSHHGPAVPQDDLPGLVHDFVLVVHDGPLAGVLDAVAVIQEGVDEDERVGTRHGFAWKWQISRMKIFDLLAL